MRLLGRILTVAALGVAALGGLGTTAQAATPTGGGCPSAPYYGSVGGFNYEFYGCTGLNGTYIQLQPHSAVQSGYTDCALVVNIQEDGNADGSRTFRPCGSTATQTIGVPNGHVYTFDWYLYIYANGRAYYSPIYDSPYVDYSGGSSCGNDNSCTPWAFAVAELTYPGVNAPVTGPNLYALQKWETREGGGAGCPANTYAWPSGGSGNPLETTKAEPGSTNWNSVGVQSYHDASGHDCWYWGIKATGDTLLNGYYGDILAVLRSPSTSNTTQCKTLASRPSMSTWGSGNWSSLC